VKKLNSWLEIDDLAVIAQRGVRRFQERLQQNDILSDIPRNISGFRTEIKESENSWQQKLGLRNLVFRGRFSTIRLSTGWNKY